MLKRIIYPLISVSVLSSALSNTASSQDETANLMPVGSEVAASDDAALDEEAMLAELRRQALEAEMGGDVGSFDGMGALSMTTEELDAMTSFPGEIGPLPATPEYPEDNQPSADRIELGHKLYFDKRLSRNMDTSCATCHDPKLGWADGRPRSRGFGGMELGRHSPTVINTAFNSAQFWDGRAATLEQQAVGPIMAEGEMNMPNEAEVLARVTGAAEYKGLFEKAYGDVVSIDNIGKAIAAFERTVITGPSRFDRYIEGDKSALSESEKRGLILFITTASCTACHKGPNFTDSKYYALGVRQDGPATVDLGRFVVTGDEKDRFAFKTPGLRNISQSAPYMHDGSLATLEEVVDFYNRGGIRHDVRSELIKPLNMTPEQQQDLVAFLKSLDGALPTIAPPSGEHFGI